MTLGPIAGLSEIITALARETPVEVAVAKVLDTALGMLGADHASVRVRDGAELRALARVGLGTGRAPRTFLVADGVVGWVARTGKPIRLDRALEDTRFAMDPEQGFAVESLLAIPLRANDRVLGVLCVSAATPQRFAEHDERVAELVAQCIAQSLRMAELERAAMTDALTGAFNRRYLVPCLAAESNRAFRSGKPLSLACMDLDHFKSVNDRYGHSVGDVVLHAFSDIVRRCVRSFDVLIRRGGEEFLLVMPSTTTTDGMRVAQRIRARLSGRPLRLGPGLSITQTVSIGLATWDGREEPGALDRRSDAAMYQAKREGRNRIIAASAAREPTPISGGPAPHDTHDPAGGLDAQS